MHIFAFQIKLWFDKVGHQLIVTILGAKDLPSREDGRPRNPYVKIYFLPDRRQGYKIKINVSGNKQEMLIAVGVLIVCYLFLSYLSYTYNNTNMIFRNQIGTVNTLRLFLIHQMFLIHNFLAYLLGCMDHNILNNVHFY